MNPFHKFGIERLSPSSLNTWRAAPGLWALRYLGKFYDNAGPGAWRGTAVEKGLHSWFIKKDGEEALMRAMDAFEAEAQGLADDQTEAERNNIAPMLDMAIKAIEHLPAPYFGAQARVEHVFQDVDVPVVGYIDFILEDGSIFDLKTTKACPSEPKADHARQVALYMAGRDAAGSLLYVTAKKSAHYPISEELCAASLESMRRDALSLQAFLSGQTDPKAAIRSLPMNDDDFRWSIAASEKLKELAA
jgi:pyrimidine deaminase RibD-like protein